MVIATTILNHSQMGVPLAADALFEVRLQGVSPGSTYSVLFAIQDGDGNISEGYLVNATAQ